MLKRYYSYRWQFSGTNKTHACKTFIRGQKPRLVFFLSRIRLIFRHFHHKLELSMLPCERCSMMIIQFLNNFLEPAMLRLVNKTAIHLFCWMPFSWPVCLCMLLVLVNIALQTLQCNWGRNKCPHNVFSESLWISPRIWISPRMEQKREQKMGAQKWKRTGPHRKSKYMKSNKY